MNDNIKAGGDIHAGDGGYSIGTKEKYDEFAKGRNQSMGKMRIKELAEQAGIYKLDIGDETAYWVLEKFAELIVRECMTNLYLNGYDDAVIQIQKHFGVEE